MEHLTTNLTTFLSNVSKKYLYKNYLGYYYFQKSIGKKIVKFSLKTKDLDKALELAKIHNKRYSMSEEELLAELKEIDRQLTLAREKQAKRNELLQTGLKKLKELEAEPLADKDDLLPDSIGLEKISIEPINSYYITHIHIEASPGG